MREILFRGKRKSTGKWLYGQLLQITLRSGRRGRFIHENPIGGYDSTTEIEDDTVGQYTGITDKNGAMVFEGDIIKAFRPPQNNDGVIGNVEFENGTFKIHPKCHYKNKEFSLISDLTQKISTQTAFAIENNFIFRGYVIEVIGNIYDNPELMEGR